jgi:hypothetical protein
MKEGKPDRKPYPLPNGLRNPYRNLKWENSQGYAQKPQRDGKFMNSASDQRRSRAPSVPDPDPPDSRVFWPPGS